MEIGTEISRKIRAAIKGKLQELGAYVDEELPDYIMVMVANKKSAQQMADDLSLFLGSNTLKFTIWLHGVLEKLRTVAVETSSLKPQPVYADIGTMSFPGKARVVAEGNIDRREDWMLPVSSSSADRTDARVSTSSSLEYRISCGGSPNEKNIHRLMSTVKPLMESSPAEAVIDIKPELDDDLIDEDLSALSDVATLPGAKKKPLVTLSYGSSHPATETYRVPDSCQYFCNASENKLQTPTRTTECALYDIRPIEVVRTSRTIPGAFSKFPENYEQNSRPRVNTERINIDEDVSRKRKSSVISSVVKISKYGNEDQDTDEMEEEDEGYPGRAGGLLSSISVPSKPERRPTLPPSKQANKNLILKAISEAQESVSKTTSYPPVPQRQTVPVAPRTRSLSGEETLAAQHVHETIYHTNTRIQLDPEREHHLQRQSVHSRLLASRLQLDIQEEALLKLQGVSELADMKPDTRSFILKKPALEEAGSLASRLGTEYAEVKPTLSERLVQSRDVAEPLRPTSPKFIVTLDGVPSPPGYENYGDDMGDLILKEKMKADKESSLYSQLERKRKLRLERDEVQNLSGSEEDFDKEAGNMKHQKVTERCRYWPTCKSGDECLYHHPATMCKTFPNCRFGDKCLFIHPTCKYDAKCTNPDCKYTHVARRRATTQLQPAAPVVPSTICRFFPDCKKMDCSFYHPKPCRFTTHCKRPDCTFYHPKVSLPPRQALKWTKTQNS